MYKLIVLFFLPTFVLSQERFDSKIIVQVEDTTGLYETVRLAYVNSDFIVKPNNNKDTISTYAKERAGFLGYIVSKAVILGNEVQISGIYGLKKINDWGFTTMPKNYQRVIYYRGSKTWPALSEVAQKIPGRISYTRL